MHWQSGRCPESDSPFFVSHQGHTFFVSHLSHLSHLSLLSLYLIKDTPGFVSICADQTSPLANQKTDQTSKQSDALLNHTSSAAFALIRIKKDNQDFSLHNFNSKVKQSRKLLDSLNLIVRAFLRTDP